MGAEDGLTVGITSLTLSWPDEDRLCIGTERGGLACVDISCIVENAKCQQKDILLRKETGEAAEVISGRIFDSMPRPCNSPEYVFALPNQWFVDKAHKGTVDSIIACRHNPCVLLTLGSDVCVRIWQQETGTQLGTLEQGLPEGLTYCRETSWCFPLDAHELVHKELDALAAAFTGMNQSSSDFPMDMGRDPGFPADEAKRMLTGKSRALRRQGSKVVKESTAAPALKRSASTPATAKSVGKESSNSTLVSPTAHTSQWDNTLQAEPDYNKAIARYLQPRKGCQPTEDWYAGPVAGYASDKSSLPRLQSGLTRPAASETRKVLEAARALARSLGDIRSSKDRAR